MAQYNIFLMERVNISEQINTTTGWSISDTVNVRDSMKAGSVFRIKLQDSVSISENFSAAKFIGLTIRESVSINDNVVTNANYLARILERVEVEASISLYNNKGLIHSGDTWVVNYETNAFSKYEQFMFNSFARIGNKYYGANEDGLFELGTEATEDEVTDNIPVKITTGFTDVSGMGMKSNVRDAELYIKNDGTMTLRAYVSDTKYFDYKLTKANDSVSTSRIKLGSGTQAVYWQFELTNDEGTDFELDQIKLYRIVSSKIL